MATRIEALTLVSGGVRRRRSSLRLAVAAGRQAVSRAGLRPADVDLLINAGLYHDENLGEPALAPLIQQDMGVNPDDPQPGRSGTFSFDVANGSCGVLSALHVADGFLRAGTAHAVLIVASDADPGHGMAPRFPFPPSGAAVVCRWADDGSGLVGFRWTRAPDGGRSFRATVAFEDGANRLDVMEDAVFAERAGEAAAEAAAGLLDEHGMAATDLDVIVAAPDRPNLVKVLARDLGVGEDSIVTDRAGFHTTGLLAAAGRAEQAGRLRPGGTVLLVCGGAGVVAGAALYRPGGAS